MLEKLTDKMQQYEQVAREQSDEIERKIRAKFDDPIAQQAQWHHLNKGSGSSSQDRKLTVARERLRIVPTLAGMTIPLLGAAGGLALVWIALDSYFQIVSSGGEPISTAAFVFLFVFGILIMGPAFLVLRSREVLTFDKSAGYFWRGRRKPSADATESSDLFRLDRIAGLQIPPRKHVHFRNNNQDRSFFSYELNMILDDNERINLMDHGDRTDIYSDANKLSEYLGVPVFNASG